MILVKLLNTVVFKEEAFNIVLGSTKQDVTQEIPARGFKRVLKGY